MNIEELKARKRKLQSDIYHLIKEFHGETSTYVTQIDYRLHTMDYIGAASIMEPTVEVEIKI